MILDEIVEAKRVRLPEHKKRIDGITMRRLAEETKTRNADCFYRNLKKPGISIIGEFKKASPSLGNITSKMNLMERIEEYNASVDAISCLTEEDYFHGNASYLKQIRSKSDLPILRKDFMIEEYQFYEAKAIGADAVLLITASLMMYRCMISISLPENWNLVYWLRHMMRKRLSARCGSIQESSVSTTGI